MGKIGEDIACRYLDKEGYRIIGRNFRNRFGEIDIIALKDNMLILVEVKTRCGRKFGSPEEAVTPRKLNDIGMTGIYYKSLHPELPPAIRIDVVAIDMDRDYKLLDIRLLQNVTN